LHHGFILFCDSPAASNPQMKKSIDGVEATGSIAQASMPETAL